MRWIRPPGKFHEPGHFRRFVEEAAIQLARLHGDRRAAKAIDALPVVIVAYSGGYYPAAWVLRQGGLGDRLRGVIILDGLYGDLDKFADWIAGHEAAFFLSAHSRSSRDENADFQRILTERGIHFTTSLPAKLTPGTVAFVGSPDEVVHRDFVTQRLGGGPAEGRARAHCRLPADRASRQGQAPRPGEVNPPPEMLCCAVSAPRGPRRHMSCAIEE